MALNCILGVAILLSCGVPSTTLQVSFEDVPKTVREENRNCWPECARQRHRLVKDQRLLEQTRVDQDEQLWEETLEDEDARRAFEELDAQIAQEEEQDADEAADDSNEPVVPHSAAPVGTYNKLEAQRAQAPPGLIAYPERPRMLVMNGCSGSTFVVHLGMILMQLHGARIETYGDAESMSSKKNPFYEQTGHDLTKAMDMSAAEAQKNNKTYILKGMLKTGDEQLLEWRQSVASLKKFQAYAIHGYRANFLDKMACQIKDCFATKRMGYPVMDGERSNLCFERRSSTLGGADSAEKYQAHFNIENLEESLNQMDHDYKWERMAMLRTGFTVHQLTTEDLSDFESDNSDEAWERGIKAWSDYLRYWGVQPQRDIIVGRIESLRSGRAGKTQGLQIENMQEVRQKLKELPQWSHLLKELPEESEMSP